MLMRLYDLDLKRPGKVLLVAPPEAWPDLCVLD